MIKKIPKVGILIPNYNLGKFIDEALDSLKKQTFQNFSVLIVDDASTDKATIDKLKKIKYKKAKVIFETHNLGLSKLSNKHLPNMPNDYIMIFSPDDILAPTYLEETVKYLNNNDNREVSAVGTWIRLIGDSKGIVKPTTRDTDLKPMLLKNSMLGSSLIRNSVLKEVGYFTHLGFHQDYVMWLDMLSHGYRLHMIPEPLFIYRIRGNSTSHTVKREQEEKFTKDLVKKFSPLYTQNIEYVIDYYIDDLYKLNEYAINLESGLKEIKSHADRLFKDNIELTRQLKEIRNSKAYRLYSKIKKFI